MLSKRYSFNAWITFLSSLGSDYSIFINLSYFNLGSLRSL